jgi:hypothetical protein
MKVAPNVLIYILVKFHIFWRSLENFPDLIFILCISEKIKQKSEIYFPLLMDHTRNPTRQFTPLLTRKAPGPLLSLSAFPSPNSSRRPYTRHAGSSRIPTGPSRCSPVGLHPPHLPCV